MKRRLNLVVILSLSLSLVLALCGPAGAAEGKTYNLRLSSEYSADNHQTIALNDAAKIIKEKTGGQVSITVYPSMQLGDYSTVYSQVMTGDIDMAAMPMPSSYDARAEIQGVPFMATDYAGFKKDYFPGSYIWQVFTEINQKLGCRLLGVFNTGFMGIGAAKLPSTDFAALTDASKKNTLLRIPPQNQYKILIPAMGYRTTTIPYADLFPALQSGVADGWIGGSGLVNWEGFRDVIKYFIDCRAVNECVLVVINEKTIAGMPEEWQKIIQDTFLQIADRVADERQAQEEKALKDMAAYGITVIGATPEQMTALRDRIRQVVWPQMKDSLGEDTLNKLCEIYGVKL